MDAADEEKFETARKELHDLLSKPPLAGIPLLVLGNKNDLPEALNEEGIIEKLYVSTACANGNAVLRCFCGDLRTCEHGHSDPSHRELRSIGGREVCCYSISAKNQVNIDITLDWLIKHSRS